MKSIRKIPETPSINVYQFEIPEGYMITCIINWGIKLHYQFPNFNGATIEIMERVSNFIPHFNVHVITYPCWDLSQSMLVKGASEMKNIHVWTSRYMLYFFYIISMRNVKDRAKESPF